MSLTYWKLLSSQKAVVWKTVERSSSIGEAEQRHRTNVFAERGSHEKGHPETLILRRELDTIIITALLKMQKDATSVYKRLHYHRRGPVNLKQIPLFACF
jgi:hypothetical protein